MISAQAIVSEFDVERLDYILGTLGERDKLVKDRLILKLDQADIHESKDVPPTVVTLNSTVLFRLSNAKEPLKMTLTLPSRKPQPEDSISILTPTGIALLGLSEGSETTYTLMNRVTATLWVDKIVYQPERGLIRIDSKQRVG
ncbi:GreA/GreB family elongation factor [Saccharospirillum sp.]|uniref:GreA/GreB family elongation factor n=1 Tax=Saccharospirillum sp. TaxID=2033801 RepID=UPI0034A0A800